MAAVVMEEVMTMVVVVMLADTTKIVHITKVIMMVDTVPVVMVVVTEGDKVCTQDRNSDVQTVHRWNDKSTRYNNTVNRLGWRVVSLALI